ncbi:hypothetical protein OROMI_023046 [Orobanche minor]
MVLLGIFPLFVFILRISLGTCQQITLYVSLSEEIHGCRWRNFINDGDFKAIKKASGCIHPLASRVLLHIGPILSNPQQQPDCLVAGSMDLVTILVKNAPIDVLKAAYQVLFDPVVRLMTTARCRLVLNMLCCWVEDTNSEASKLHLPRIYAYFWGAGDGMKIQVRVALERRIFLKNAEAVV